MHSPSQQKLHGIGFGIIVRSVSSAITRERYYFTHCSHAFSAVIRVMLGLVCGTVCR